jgi:hypothetical protein
VVDLVDLVRVGEDPRLPIDTYGVVLPAVLPQGTGHRQVLLSAVITSVVFEELTDPVFGGGPEI